jgi:hypothetical protein
MPVLELASEVVERINTSTRFKKKNPCTYTKRQAGDIRKIHVCIHVLELAKY